jgi:signal transduction histidine kinase
MSTFAVPYVWGSRALRFARGAPVFRIVLGSLLLAGAYYCAAQLGYALSIAGPVAAIVWFPVGVGIAFLYRGGLWLWPGVLIGDLLANDYSAIPVGSAIGQTAGNVLEVVVAAAILRRLARRGSPIGDLRSLGLTVAALAAGTALSATVGNLSLLAGGVVDVDSLPTVWRTWWIGDLTGAIVVVPLAIAWQRPPSRHWLRTKGLETALLLGSATMITLLASSGNASLMYLGYPILAVWAALRLGRRGATIAAAAASVLILWRTAHDGGPFHFESISADVLSTQLAIGLGVLGTLVLAIVAAERVNLEREVRRSHARLVQAADAERQRIERDIHDGAQQRLVALASRLREAGELVTDAPARATALIEQAEDELTHAIGELRQLSQGLRPAVLHDFGLAHAIRAIAARSDLPVHVGSLPAGRFDATAELTAYFVVAEAVANVQKHAQASRVLIHGSAWPGHLSIAIADDGVGRAVELDGGGLQGLRDRVEAIGGKLTVVSPQGGGTGIAARIPATAVPD